MSTLKARLFPQQARLFPGQRWLNILLRSLHLVGVAGVGSGFLFSIEESAWLPYWYLTLGSGGAMVLLYLWSDARWLLQLKGLAVIIKLLLLAVAVTSPSMRTGAFVLVVLISGIIAHAPGKVRGYSPRRV